MVRGGSRSIRTLLLTFAVGLVFSVSAAADLVQFEMLSVSPPRLITLESVKKDDVAFVPVQNLVEQAGGSYNVLPTRLRVDLGGSTAWLRTGEARVHALSIFSLTRPIVEDESGALIAVSDVPDFFLKSFRMTMRPYSGQSAATAIQPPQPSATTPGTPTITLPETPKEASPPLEQLGNIPARPGVVTAIILDAGHGGYDTGLQSTDKRAEDAVVLGIATRLKKLLESGNAPPVMLTRAEDLEIQGAQRARIAEGFPGAIFVSLHAGSSLSPTTEGVAVFYATPTGTTGTLTGTFRADALLVAESRRLAELVGPAAALSASTPLRGIVQAPLKVLSEIRMPGIEIEVGCLTSAADTAKLGNDEYLGQLATGIFNGITAYLSGATPAAPSATPPAAPEGQ